MCTELVINVYTCACTLEITTNELQHALAINSNYGATHALYQLLGVPYWQTLSVSDTET